MNLLQRHKHHLVVLGLIAVVLFCYIGYRSLHHKGKKDKGFSVSKIMVTGPKALEKQPVPSHVRELLQGPLLFLGKGKQFFAFSTPDNAYVVKFIQQQRFDVQEIASGPHFMKAWFNKREIKKREERRKALIESSRIAYEVLPEETAVIYTHLERTVCSLPKVTLIDRMGDIFEVDLNDTQFVVQKKCELLKPTIVQLMAKKNEVEARKRIDAIFALLVACAKKGVQDIDGALIRNDNIGFIGDRAVYIDMGKFEIVKGGINEVRFQYDFRRLKPFYNWLRKNYPRLAHHYLECRERARI